jgi:hypothetical protein
VLLFRLARKIILKNLPTIRIGLPTTPVGIRTPGYWELIWLPIILTKVSSSHLKTSPFFANLLLYTVGQDMTVK